MRKEMMEFINELEMAKAYYCDDKEFEDTMYLEFLKLWGKYHSLYPDVFVGEIQLIPDDERDMAVRGAFLNFCDKQEWEKESERLSWELYPHDEAGNIVY